MPVDSRYQAMVVVPGLARRGQHRPARGLHVHLQVVNHVGSLLTSGGAEMARANTFISSVVDRMLPPPSFAASLPVSLMYRLSPQHMLIFFFLPLLLVMAAEL